MREIVIRNLSDEEVSRLEQRASSNGRTLEEEIRVILTEGVAYLERVAVLLKEAEETMSRIPPPPHIDKEKIRRIKERREQGRQSKNPQEGHD